MLLYKYLNRYLLNSNPSRLSFVTVWNAWSLFILVQCEFIFGLCCWCGFTETQYCIYPVCNDEENLYWHTCWTVSIHILPQSQTCSLFIHQLCAFLWSFSLVDFCAASYSIGPIGIGFLAVNGSHSPPFPVELLVSWTHQNNLKPKRDTSLEFPCNCRLSQELRKKISCPVKSQFEIYSSFEINWEIRGLWLYPPYGWNLAIWTVRK